jgi:hypothetical protein
MRTGSAPATIGCMKGYWLMGLARCGWRLAIIHASGVILLIASIARLTLSLNLILFISLLIMCSFIGLELIAIELFIFTIDC